MAVNRLSKKKYGWFFKKKSRVFNAALRVNDKVMYRDAGAFCERSEKRYAPTYSYEEHARYGGIGGGYVGCSATSDLKSMRKRLFVAACASFSKVHNVGPIYPNVFKNIMDGTVKGMSMTNELSDRIFRDLQSFGFRLTRDDRLAAAHALFYNNIIALFLILLEMRSVAQSSLSPYAVSALSSPRYVLDKLDGRLNAVKSNIDHFSYDVKTREMREYGVNVCGTSVSECIKYEFVGNATKYKKTIRYAINELYFEFLSDIYAYLTNYMTMNNENRIKCRFSTLGIQDVKAWCSSATNGTMLSAGLRKVTTILSDFERLLGSSRTPANHGGDHTDFGVDRVLNFTFIDLFGSRGAFCETYKNGTDIVCACRSRDFNTSLHKMGLAFLQHGDDRRESKSGNNYNHRSEAYYLGVSPEDANVYSFTTIVHVIFKKYDESASGALVKKQQLSSSTDKICKKYAAYCEKSESTEYVVKTIVIDNVWFTPSVVLKIIFASIMLSVCVAYWIL